MMQLREPPRKVLPLIALDEMLGTARSGVAALARSLQKSKALLQLLGFEGRIGWS